MPPDVMPCSSVGISLTLEAAVIEVPTNPGKVVRLNGITGEDKTFTPLKNISEYYQDKSGRKAKVTTTYTNAKGGTFFPTVRAASQREGASKTPFTKIWNLGKARVIIK